MKIKDAVLWLDEAALRHKVEMEVRAEREKTRRMKAQEWEIAKKNKDALLAQLSAFESMAKDSDRARSIRRFMDEIATSTTAPAELVGSLQLMALMADWLDPLVKERWPEVDEIGERNPYGGLWQ